MSIPEINITYLHLDSTNQVYETGSKYSTYAIIPNNRQYAPNGYNVKFKMRSPFQNIKRIYLKSFETAILFPNIRASSLLNTITVNCNSTLKTIIIPDNTYTSLTTLCADLNTLVSSQFPSDGLTFSVSTTTNAGNICVNSSVHSSVQVERTNLGQQLGFRKSMDTLSTNNCYGSYKPNLAFDKFIHVYIPSLGNSNNDTNNGILSSFKILTSSQSNVVNYTTENISFGQFINVSNPTTPISEIHVLVYDFLGYSLNSAGADISMTLALSNV